MIRRTPAIVVLALALAGCSRSRLELDPRILPGCNANAKQVVRVTWDASASGANWVYVGILRPGESVRGWIEAGPKGSSATGPWASDGLTFVLITDRGRELARRTLEAAPCPSRQATE